MRGRLIGFIGLLCLWAVPAFAQTAGPGSHLAWDQIAPDLATAQGYTYLLTADAGTATVVAGTCTGALSPFVCTTPIPAFTPGPHTVVLTAGNVAGASLPSAPFAFTFVVIPSTPTGLRIVK